jgi:hypothetical protein
MDMEMDEPVWVKYLHGALPQHHANLYQQSVAGKLSGKHTPGGINTLPTEPHRPAQQANPVFYRIWTGMFESLHPDMPGFAFLPTAPMVTAGGAPACCAFWAFPAFPGRDALENNPDRAE